MTGIRLHGRAATSAPGSTVPADAIGWPAGIGYGLLAPLLVIAFGARRLPMLRDGGLINPDSFMRMVRLRDEIAAGQILHVVARDGAGDGTVLHWSHLLDSLICLIALPLGLFLEPQEALRWAAALVGPISIGAAGFAIVWAVAPFARRGWLWVTPLLIAVSPAIAGYGMLGVAHHHVGVILVGVTAIGLAARVIAGHADERSGWCLGVWAGAGVWLTPETLPLTIVAFGALWVAWLTGPNRAVAGAIRATGLAFLLVVTAALAVDPPFAGYGSADVDRISIVFVALAAAIAATGLVVQAMDQRVTRPRWRAAGSGLAGLCCAGAWAACFPSAVHPAASLVTAAEWHAMFDPIVEMQPVNDLSGMLQYLLAGAVTTGLMGALSLRRRDPVLLYATLCSLGFVVFGQLHVRFAAYPAAAAAAALPIALTMTERMGPAWRESYQSGARLALIAVFMLVPYGGSLPDVLAKAHAAKLHAAEPTCSVDHARALLAPYAGRVMLANVSDSPELLYRTGIRTVGSLYHRNPAGFLRLRAAWRSPPADTVPESLTATRATLVLFCKTSSRSPLITDLPADTLLDRLNRDEVPAWLRRVAADPASGNVLYEVLP